MLVVRPALFRRNPDPGSAKPVEERTEEFEKARLCTTPSGCKSAAPFNLYWAVDVPAPEALAMVLERTLRVSGEEAWVVVELDST